MPVFSFMNAADVKPCSNLPQAIAVYSAVMELFPALLSRSAEDHAADQKEGQMILFDLSCATFLHFKVKEIS